MGMGGNRTNEGSTYDNKYSLSFRRAPKEEKPFFSVRQYFPEANEMPSVTKISGTFKGIIYNEAKNIITKMEGKEVTIPPKFTVVIEDGTSVYYVEVSTDCGSQLRPLLNSLLSVEVGQPIELSTYFSKGYKVISVTNPLVKKTITFEKNGETKTAEVNEGYSWAFNIKDLPEIEVIKNKAGEVKSVDDSEQLAFLKNAIMEKFSKKEEPVGELDISDVPFK